MLPALWSDQFESSTQIRQSFVEAFPVGWNGEAAASTSMSLAIEERLGRMTHVDVQLSTFTGWRYVYINRIMECLGQLRPSLGKKKGKRRKPTVTKADQKFGRYMRQFYGVRQSEIEEFATIARHPVLDLLEKPNRDDTFSSFIAELAMFDELTGEFFIWVGSRNGLGQPVEIFAFGRNGMRPYVDQRTGQLLHFELLRNGMPIKQVPVTDVAWYRRKSPFGKLESMSPTVGGGRWVMSEALIELSRATRFSNGGAPDVFLELDVKSFPSDVTETQLSRISEKLQKRFGLRNTHGGIIPLAPGVKANQVGHSPREMDFSQSSKDVRDNLGSLHGVSKFIVGQTEDMNHNQVIEAHQGFYGFKLNPMAARVAEVLTHFLLPMYDPTAIERGAFIYFPDESPESPEEERKETELDIQCKAISPNERRLARGRELKAGAAYDSCWASTSDVPLDPEAQDEVIPAPDEPDDPEAEDDAPAEGKKKKAADNGEEGNAK